MSNNPREGKASAFPSYDPDGPWANILTRMLDALDRESPLREEALLHRGSLGARGGGLVSYMRERKIPDTDEGREQAVNEVVAIQLGWLERLGGARREDGLVHLVNRTIQVPVIDGWEIKGERTYTAGDTLRGIQGHENRLAQVEAWNAVLFGRAKSKKGPDGSVWTRGRILDAIEEARGPLNDQTVALLSSSMQQIGYDEAYPMLIWSDGGDKYIVDGRHRDAAAKENDLDPVIVTRRYNDVWDLLAAIVRADETRKDYDSLAQAESWASIGFSLNEIRVHAGVDAEQARLRQEQRNRERRGQRQRQKDGVAAPAQRPEGEVVAALAQEISEAKERGENVNVAAEARKAGLKETTLRDAVRRRKPDMSGSRRPVAPEPTPPEPTPRPSLTSTYVCDICGVGGPEAIDTWMRPKAGWEYTKRRPSSGGHQPTSRAIRPNGLCVHTACLKKLTPEENEALLRKALAL